MFKRAPITVVDRNGPERAWDMHTAPAEKSSLGSRLVHCRQNLLLQPTLCRVLKLFYDDRFYEGT